MANSDHRNGYAAGSGLWRKLAAEIRPHVDAAMLRAKKEFTWIEPWQANLSIIKALDELGPRPPWAFEDDEDDPGPPPEPEERGCLTLPWDEDDYSVPPQDEGGSLPPP